jgi:hypothetical protein
MLILQGLLDLDLLAHACGVYKAPHSRVLADEQKKRAKGIKTFNRRDQWGLAGVFLPARCYPGCARQAVAPAAHHMLPLALGK